MGKESERKHLKAQAPKKAADKTKTARNELAAIIAHIEKRPKHSLFHSGPVGSHANANCSSGSNGITPDLRAPLHIHAIDQALDGKTASGLAINALHEVRVETGLAAASGAGFALCLGLMMHQAKRQTGKDHLPDEAAPIFWISDHYTRQEYGQFYGLGMKTLGLKGDRLVRIHVKSREDLLWAAGEIADTPGAAAFCLIEIRKHPKEMDLTATRRLLLRAQASMTPVILLRQSGEEEASAAATRWLVSPAPSQAANGIFHDPAAPLLHQFIGPPTFHVSLEKCRGGRADPSTKWTLEWNRNDQRFVSIEPACTHVRADDRSKDHDDTTGRTIIRL